jgi:hypothetical protein
MIETQVPLKFPPGLQMNGTMMDREGVWADGNNIRFVNGMPQPVGAIVALGGVTIPGSFGAASAGYVWNWSGSTYVVFGSHTKVFVHPNVGSSATITPAGQTDPGNAVTWAFTDLDGVLLLSHAGYGFGNPATLWSWDPNVGGVATVPAGAPSSSVRGVFVTPERFVVAIQGMNILKWPSQGSLTDWTPSGINSAGSLNVPTPNFVMAGRPLLGETLIFTTGDLWSFNYVGGDLIYGLKKLGDHCGIIGANAVAIAMGKAYWMGDGEFYVYDGYVRPLPCSVRDYVFGDIDLAYGHRFFTISIPTYNEIQFWYLSTAAVESPDRFVSYNYLENVWSKGFSDRAAGGSEWHTGLGVGGGFPIMIHTTSANVYLHGQPGATAQASIASGPVQMEDGNRTAKIQKIIPDGADTSDTVSLYVGGFPNEAETLVGPLTVPAAGAPIDVRVSARKVRYVQTFNAETSRAGVPRLGIIPSSKR